MGRFIWIFLVVAAWGSVAALAKCPKPKTRQRIGFSVSTPDPLAVEGLDKGKSWLNFLPWVFSVTPGGIVDQGIPSTEKFFWEIRLLGLQFKPLLRLSLKENFWRWQLADKKQKGPLSKVELKLKLTSKKKEVYCFELSNKVVVSSELPMELKAQLQKELTAAWGADLPKSLKFYLRGSKP